MSLYLSNGYFDFASQWDKCFTWNIVVGGRGTGKTYSALRYHLENSIPHIYMRRSGEEASFCATKEFTPYSAVCDDLGWSWDVSKGKIKMVSVNDSQQYISAIVALSTIANIRGFNAGRMQSIIYDEFIPERVARPIKNEGAAFLNAYETLNRNRELNGEPPMRVWLLANSNRIDSPILAELDLLNRIQRMTEKHVTTWEDRERSVRVLLLYDSPISDRKKGTALYKLAGQSYKDMALENSFRADNTVIGERDLRQYRLVAKYGELYIYASRHGDGWYVSWKGTGSPRDVYGPGETETELFMRKYSIVYKCSFLGLTLFQDRAAEYRFRAQCKQISSSM